MALSVTGIDVENVTFLPSVKAPGSTETFYLRGAGVRELDVGGKSVKTGAIGVYPEDNAVPMLAAKWKGKTAEELTDSAELFRDMVTGPFQKFTRVTALMPFAGGKYAENVAEQCVAILKSLGTYTEAEAKAIDKFLEVFKAQSFAPGASFLFTHSALGSLTISFSKDGSIPEAGSAVIENKPLSEAVLESIIGENGVSPTTKKSLATRLPEFINK